MAPRRASSRIECDLHGMRTADVAARLEALARAHQAAGATVRVIHGKGDGLLAAEVERWARGDPRVADFYRSGVNAGVTIVRFQPGAAPPRAAVRRCEEYAAPPVRGAKR